MDLKSYITTWLTGTQQKVALALLEEVEKIKSLQTINLAAFETLAIKLGKLEKAKAKPKPRGRPKKKVKALG